LRRIECLLVVGGIPAGAVSLPAQSPARDSGYRSRAMDAVAAAASHTPLVPRRVWDLPTRVFHWLLAATIVGSVVSAKIGGNAMAWHLRFGYLVFALLLFRLLWGLVGGHWSRFASFLHPPSRVIAYLRGERGPQGLWAVGHSPLGALSVFALLAILSVQVATGLVADDEIATTGPLYAYVSGATSAAATGWHKGAGQVTIFVLVGLHLAAIAHYDLWRRERLTRAMWRGDKPLPATLPASRDTAGTRAAALALFAACVALVAWVTGGAW
jgi:cytochrome b